MAQLIVGIVGIVMSVRAQKQQTAATKATAKYNAALAQQKADEERRMGALRAEAKRKQTRQLLASQRAAYAKARIRPAGTPLLVQTETAKNEALNALLLARGSEVSAQSFESQRSLFRTQATNVARAGRLRVGAELFQGVGSMMTAATPRTTS